MRGGQEVPPELVGKPAIWKLWVAYGVHVFTASGVVAGFVALDAIIRGDARAAFFWMGVALFIDSVDGTLARRAKVRDLLPKLDGALLDNLIDYFNYVIIPAFFFHVSGILPKGWEIVGVAVICLASAYQFCRIDAKTDDHYFRGFPSYWNAVVFYAIVLALPPWLNMGVILLFGVLVFVPVKYIYPSRAPRHPRLNVALPALWSAVALVIIYQLPEPSKALVWGSLLYPVYYMTASLYYTIESAIRR